MASFTADEIDFIRSRGNEVKHIIVYVCTECIAFISVENFAIFLKFSEIVFFYFCNFV